MKLITVFTRDYFTHVSLGPRLLNDANELEPTGNPKEIHTVILNVESNRPYVDREIPAANA